MAAAGGAEPRGLRRLRALSQHLTAGGGGDKDAGTLSYERATAAFSSQDSARASSTKHGGVRVVFRAIEFYEFDEKLADIDRSGSGAGIYGMVDSKLALDRTKDESWGRQRRWMIADRVRACVQRGGAIIGAFDIQPNRHQVLVGAAVLDGQWMGKGMDTLDVSFLFASSRLPDRYVEAGGTQKDFRTAGIEQTLFEKIAAEAKARGARQLYISAAAHLGALVKLPGMTQPLAPSAYM